MGVALVTGSSTGIGLATAVALARAGHQVVATMRNPSRAPELASTAAKEKLPIRVLPMDVDDDGSVRNTIGELLSGGGRIDILVNNAGIALLGPTEELPLAEFRRAMETNYFGALRCVKAVLPGMRERRSGHIIIVSSIGGRVSLPSEGPYNASKYALEAFSEGLAAEVMALGIKVSILEPGTIDTPIFDKMRAAPPNPRYPHERRLFAIFKAGMPTASTPALVGEKVVEILNATEWKLRHLVGFDAAALMQYRASKTDEEWATMLGTESDHEFAAILKREIGMEIDLS